MHTLTRAERRGKNARTLRELLGEEAEATGHAVERLDYLNTRSYSRAVLELANRREKLLGKKNPSREERRVLKWKLWSIWQILGWWQQHSSRGNKKQA